MEDFKHKSRIMDLFIYMPCSDERLTSNLYAQIPELRQIEELIKKIRANHKVGKVEIYFNPDLETKEPNEKAKSSDHL